MMLDAAVSASKLARMNGFMVSLLSRLRSLTTATETARIAQMTLCELPRAKGLSFSLGVTRGTAGRIEGATCPIARVQSY